MRVPRAFWLIIVLLFSCAHPPRENRIIVLGIDGLDPQTVEMLIAEGQLPHLARLLQAGAYAPLISQKPLMSPVIWTTIATGRTPDEHGISHFLAIDQASGEYLPVTSRMRRVKALWNIASEAGRKVATVGWWATWPPESVNGVVVSDHTAYHFLSEAVASGGDRDEPKTYPPEAEREIAHLVRRPDDITYQEIQQYANVRREAFDRRFDFQDDLGHLRWILSSAMSYRDIGLELWRQRHPDLLFLYIEGTDSASHLFGHLFRASGLVGELARQQESYGSTVEEMYRFADRLVGAFLDEMDERTTLAVMSDHGFALGTPHDDPTRIRSLKRVSGDFHRPEGVLFLYGAGISPGAILDGPRLTDVAPTLLALLGMAPAADMPGRVLDEALLSPFDGERIASYESQGGRHREGDVASDTTVDAAILERLEALGYLGSTPSLLGRRHLAGMHFEAARYEEAAALYQELLPLIPEDPVLLVSLAGALGALGRNEEALEILERALLADPLSAEAYHNRALVYEQLGDTERATADLRTALRYHPNYLPSRAALERMTGSSEPEEARSAAEREALRLADAASRAARRGNYEEALSLLGAAERSAPRLAVIHQYRSNVAYLRGDRETAIAALRRALALEPDNLLYQNNLASLLREEPPE